MRFSFPNCQATLQTVTRGATPLRVLCTAEVKE